MRRMYWNATHGQKMLLAFIDSGMIQLIDFELRPYDQMVPFDRDALVAIDDINPQPVVPTLSYKLDEAA
jgi:hypothetical protein